MSKYVSVVRRKEGHGLKHVKTHSVLHVPDDILSFGSPNNWNSARVESGHKFHAKAPAKLTQLRKDRLEEQVAAQTTNLLALDMATDLIWKSKKDYLGSGNNGDATTSTPSAGDTLSKVFNGGTRFVLKVRNVGKCCNFQWIEQRKGKAAAKSNTTIACTHLFDNHVYDKQMKFLATLFSRAMADSFPIGSNFVITARF
jgi:hypothetical protein